MLSVEFPKVLAAECLRDWNGRLQHLRRPYDLSDHEKLPGARIRNKAAGATVGNSVLRPRRLAAIT